MSPRWAVCDKAGKKACQDMCDKDKNEHACAHVKTMKTMAVLARGYSRLA